MVKQDTIELLKQCDSGVQMGISSIDDVARHAQSPALKQYLKKNRAAHEELREEVGKALHRLGYEGKKPNPMVENMSHMKTRLRLMSQNRDAAIASLMMDGCNMGIKSLSRYLCKYGAADEDSRRIAHRLISLEDELAHEMRTYL